MTTRVGDSKLEFGTTDETWGLVQTVSVEESAERKEAPRGNGSIAAVEYYNAGVKKVSGTYLFRAELESASPSAHVGDGTAITLQTSGDSIYIDRVTGDRKVGDLRQVSFEGMFWPNLGS